MDTRMDMLCLIYERMNMNNLLSINFISTIEDRYILKLTEAFGYVWAVRIFDFIMIFTTVAFTLMLAFVLSANLVRTKHAHIIRFSDTMDGFVYMWAERKGIKEVIIKRPHNFRDKIEVIIALFWIRFFDHVPLRERKAKRISAIVFIIFIIMLILMVIFLLIAYNVVINPVIDR